MLNWLQNVVHHTQRTRRNLKLSMCLGLLVSMAIIGQQEWLAWHELTTLEFMQRSSILSPPSRLKADLSADATALSEAQKTVWDLIAWQKDLAHRQAKREDISAVQEAWRIGRKEGASKTTPAISFRTQQWQNGLFTWEGLAHQSGDVAYFLQALNRFPGWLQAPVVVHVQSDLSGPSSGAPTAWVFQIQAGLDAKQGPGS